MERNNSLSKTLKDHRVGSNAAHSHRTCSARNPWNHYGGTQTYGISEDNNYLCGISWPPRSYSCSFCKREFRSAQALGGHMNVHRRDRARLRQSSPVEDFHHYPCLSLSTKPSPSPNPNPNSNLIVTCSASFPTKSHSLASPPPLVAALFSSASASVNEVKSTTDQDLVETLRSRAMESRSKTMSNASSRAQETGGRYKCSRYSKMEIDLLSGSNHDYIDLELRLGCP